MNEFLTILATLVAVIIIYCIGFRHGARTHQVPVEPTDPDACHFGQEETGGYFIGRRHCHTHGRFEDLGKPRCPVGEQHDQTIKLPPLIPGQSIHFEQGEFVVLDVTAGMEDGQEMVRAPDSSIATRDVGKRVRTHVHMVDRESNDRDHRIQPWPPATDWNVPGA